MQQALSNIHYSGDKGNCVRHSVRFIHFGFSLTCSHSQGYATPSPANSPCSSFRSPPNEYDAFHRTLTAVP